MKKKFLTLLMILASLSQAFTNSTILYMPFNGNPNDVSPSQNSVSINGADLVPNRFNVENTAYAFDGVSNKVWVNGFNLPDSNVTVTLWVKPNPQYNPYTNRNIISKHTGEQDVEILIKLEKDGKYDLEWTIGSSFMDMSATGTDNDLVGLVAPSGNWDYLTATYDGDSVLFYVNGQLAGARNASGSITHNSHIMILGGGQQFDECIRTYIDDVRIYNRVLSTPEIINNYNGRLLCSFTANPASGFSPLNVKFTGNIQGVDSSFAILNTKWDFNKDGIIDADSSLSPTHVYTENGKYSVSLTVNDLEETCSFTVDSLINVYSTSNGLVADYPLDGNCTDISGNNLNGTVIEAVPAMNRFNQADMALSFDGNNDYAVLDNSSYLNMGTSARTFSIWANIKDKGDIQCLFAKANRNPPFTGYAMHTNLTSTGSYSQSGYRFDLIQNHNGQYLLAYSPKVVSDSTWHHFVCVYTAEGNLNLYLDGKLDSLVTFTGTPGVYNTDYSTPLEIGDRGHYGQGGAYHVNGKLDEFKVYNRALNSAEIQYLYNIQMTSIQEQTSKDKNVAIMSNYPNPFNPTTTINFELSKDAKVLLSVYNAKGELVNTLVNGMKSAGKNSINFDGNSLNSGVYFYKLDANGTSVANKMILCK